MPQPLPTVHQAEVEDVVSRWLALPEEERPYATLRELFEAHGWPRPDKHLYEIARSPATYHKVHTHLVSDVLARMPEILHRLAADAASDARGNNRAAEILLNHVRQTLSDERMMEIIKPRLDPNTLMSAMVSGAKELLQLSRALPGDEAAARARFQEMRHTAEPAQLTEGEESQPTISEMLAQREQAQPAPTPPEESHAGVSRVSAVSE